MICLLDKLIFKLNPASKQKINNPMKVLEHVPGLAENSGIISKKVENLGANAFPIQDGEP